VHDGFSSASSGAPQGASVHFAAEQMIPETALAVYCIALLLLSLISLNRYVLVSFYRRGRSRGRWTEGPAALREDELPLVVVQLPIFNERYVVERLVRSATELDYPLAKLSIQLLDDSTDDTVELARALAAHYRARGFDIEHIHRSDREGFKSGALANGLLQTNAEFVALFDADFVIPPQFLRTMLPQMKDPAVGIAQARWGYLNEEYSTLTRATAIGLDAQFAIEQTGRAWGGLFLGFNGTGTLLRTKCIESAGGWQHDTITEDLDLSYRAQLAGWRIAYVPSLVCPSELPADIHGLKAQQFRWTKGTQETAKKMLPRLLHSDFSPWMKLQGALHLLSNSTYPVLLVVGIVNPLVVVIAHHSHIRIAWPISAYFIFSLFGTFSYHGEAERALHPDWRRRMLYFPAFLAQSIGMSVNNAKAAIEAWIGIKTGFMRTPKYDLTRRDQRWQQLRYRSRFSWTVLAEIVMTAYTTAGIVYAIVTDEWGALPFLVLFAAGYGLVASYSIRHGLARLSWTRPAQLELGGEVAEVKEPIAADALGTPALPVLSER
jgi:cellulose synthase/poly-beta-1,6-N-acetylglucosamine synthase-like glycosyltransferase